MRAVQANEVEERRVIRQLARLADDVAALPDEEVHRAVESASARARMIAGGARSRRPARRFSAVAAAAVVALAFLVQVEAHGERSPAAPGGAPIAAFPEGNALQLLLSPRETR